MKNNAIKIVAVLLPIFWSLITFFGIQSNAGARDSGGGDFTIPVFWKRVDQDIRPTLNALLEDKFNFLTKNQIETLLSLMNPEVTKIELSTNPLLLNNKTVDAINYPSERKIKLYKTTWQSMVNQGFDVNHLILHEFMGLAKISDSKHISAKIMPPRKLPISFDSNQIECGTSMNYLVIENGRFYVRQYPSTIKKFSFPEVKTLNPNAKCAKLGVSGDCLQYVANYKLKSFNVQLPVAMEQGHVADGLYLVDMNINLISDYYNYGWGAAAEHLFQRLPQLNVVSKVLIQSSSGTQVINMQTTQTTGRDAYSNITTILQELPVPALINQLSANGYQLQIAPYRGELTEFLNTYSIIGFLEQTARSQGMISSGQIDSFVVNHMLKGAKFNSLPFMVNAYCRLLSEEN